MSALSCHPPGAVASGAIVLRVYWQTPNAGLWKAAVVMHV
jgi:hypothetical protein